MKANPGGQLDVKNIVGRGVQIIRYWEILEGRGIYVNDLRRIGKTQIMVKMHAEPPSGWISIKADLSACHTAAEFASRVFRDSHGALGAGGKAFRSMEKLFGSLSGVEIAGVLKLPGSDAVAPWKEVLKRTFDDLEAVLEEKSQRLVFFWDEVPFLIDNIAKKEGAQTAMEVLDVLRSLTQDHDCVRLFLTGSIGLHHVLSDLHQGGYNGSPLNRMAHEQPGPLQTEDAIFLAENLLAGEAVRTANPREMAAHIAAQTGNMPYYIQLLISRLSKAAHTKETVSAILEEELTAKANAWDLKHHRDRLDHYYKGEQKKAALAVLDIVAMDQPVTFDEIRSLLAAKMIYDDEDLRDLLELLCKDHYLRFEGGHYYFYLELIRRWWRIHRHL